jgi:colanic acid biosynthesis glycosyl transferase WcaI
VSRFSVTLICQWYAPEPVAQPGWIAQAIARLGVGVEVLTGIPNYPTGRVQGDYSAWRAVSEDVDGVTVHRTPEFPSHDANAARRILNYLSWALSSTVFGQRHLKRRNVALVYSSPATAALPALVARALHGVPYVLLVQDIWPDSIFASGLLRGRTARVAEAIVDRFVAATYRRAAHIAVISPGMVDLLASRGVPKDKISLIYNWIEADHATAPAESTLRHQLGLSSDDFVVMYAGNHGAAQALDSAVDAFALIPESERCHLVMVGDGIEKRRLRQQAERTCPGRVHFLSPQPRASMAGIMAAADVHLVSLADEPLFAVTMPSKVQSILSAGQPLLVASNGDAAKVAAESGAGLSAGAEDPQGLADAVQRFRKLPVGERRVMGMRGRKFYESHMSEKVGARQLVDVLGACAVRKEGSRN